MSIAILLIAAFDHFGIWWGLPLLLSATILAVFLFSLPLSLPLDEKVTLSRAAPFPLHFWLFVLFAFLYGIVQTVNGNWTVIYMEKFLHTSRFIALLSLTFFWSTFTLGRIFFATIARIISPTLTFCILPIIAAGGLLLTSELSPGGSGLESTVFALSGLGCSALLPLTISLANNILPSIGTSTIAGWLASFYLFGYGVAAFGVGPLLDIGGIDLAAIFKFSSFIALSLAILAFAILHLKKRLRR